MHRIGPVLPHADHVDARGTFLGSAVVPFVGDGPGGAVLRDTHAVVDGRRFRMYQGAGCVGQEDVRRFQHAVSRVFTMSIHTTLNSKKKMEEGFDEFAQPKSSEQQATIEPEIKSIGEIVASAVFAKETQSATEKLARNVSSYGDLPESCWETREEQERRWMAPGPDDPIYDLESTVLPHPERSVILGTNGVLSFALQCMDSTGVPHNKLISGGVPHEKETEEQKVTRIKADFEAYAEKNAAFGYKYELGILERKSLYASVKHDISITFVQGEARHLKNHLVDMGKVDSSLREVVTRLVPKVDEKIAKLPPKLAKKQSAKMAPREFAPVEYLSAEFVTLPKEGAVAAGELTTFRLLVCKTPTDYSALFLDEKKKKKLKDKRPKWVDVDIMFDTQFKSVPAGAFNDTHLAILSLQAAPLLYVDLFELPTDETTAKNGGSLKLTRTKRFAFQLPSQFCDSGLAGLHLSSAGVLSMSYGNGVLVFDTLEMVPGIHVILLDKRSVLSCAVFHPPAYPRPQDHWSGSILIGTDKGECYAVDWRAGKVIYVESTPAIEPVFGVHYSNGKLMMQTVMSITGIISNLNRFTTVLPIDRPLAFDSCGSLICVLSKYGFLKVMSSLARHVAREIPAPQGMSRTATMQHAYKGLRAYTDHVVCVYPNGIVRNLVLSPQKK